VSDIQAPSVDWYMDACAESDHHVSLWSAVGLAIAITACSPSSPDKTNTPRAAPTPPTAPSPPPSSPGEEVLTLSGGAYEHTPAGPRRLGGLPLLVHGRIDGTWVDLDVVTDAAGQYQVTGLEREYVSVGARPQADYLSPCSAQLHLWTGSLDIHVVSRANLLAMGTPRSMPPFVQSPGYAAVVVLSGYVTESSASGGRPIAEASVEHFYGDGRSGDPSGFTLTNADGYYVLCGYWDDYGQSVRVDKAGYRASSQSFGASVRIDFELTPE
jgi:hypothetical protein